MELTCSILGNIPIFSHRMNVFPSFVDCFKYSSCSDYSLGLGWTPSQRLSLHSRSARMTVKLSTRRSGTSTGTPPKLWSNNKLWKLKPILKSWPSSYRRKRHEEVALCRLRIGDVCATHKYIICGEAKPWCSSCHALLTVALVLLSCPRLRNSCRRHLGHITPDAILRHLLGDELVWIQVGSLFSYLQDLKFAVIYFPQQPPNMSYERIMA